MKLDMCILGRIRVLLAERMGTNWIDAQGVSRNVFDVLLDRDLATLEMALLERLADHAGLASLFDLGLQPNERVVLTQRQF